MADEKVTKLETEEALEPTEAQLTEEELDGVVGGRDCVAIYHDPEDGAEICIEG